LYNVCAALSISHPAGAPSLLSGGGGGGHIIGLERNMYVVYIYLFYTGLYVVHIYSV
jgi:hypothetical protein